VRLRRYRGLVWALVLSLAVHFVLVPLLVGLFGLRHALVEPKEATYQVSTVLRLLPKPKSQQRPHAHRQRVQAHVQPHAQPPAPSPQPRAETRLAVQPPPRRELVKIDERAHIAVPHLSPAIDVAQQQAQFQKTIERLRRQSDPVAAAAGPVATPGAPVRYAFDFHGSVGASPHGEGILTPVKSWHDGPYTYYYVRYWVQYADGTTETGYVPWPIRYLPQNDPFLLHWEHFPLPAPLPGYALPSDTNAHPLVAFCYEHRDEYNTCPIAHD
jgi:hypothetical protein